MSGSLSTFLTLVVLAAIVTGVVLVFRKLSQRADVYEKIQQQRRTHERVESTNVRRMDLVKPNREEASKEAQARALIRAGRVKEGAEILESINLLRPAIAALEQSGQVDEACSLLLKIGRPNRAAAIYARNGDNLKAAEQFVAAQMYEEAALQYMEVGKNDPKYFAKAAKLFQKLGSVHKALDCYMLSGNVDKVVELAITGEAWVTLARFMDTPERAAKVLESLPAEKTKQFIGSLPLETSIVERFGMWAAGSKRVDFLGAILPRVSTDLGLLITLWRSMPDDMCSLAVRGILNSMSPKSQSERTFFMRNARALFELGRFVASAALYAEAGRHAMAAKCWALYGNFDKCLENLERAGESYLANAVREVLESAENTEIVTESGQKTWSSYISSDIHRILASIDPQNDEGMANSPFTMHARAKKAG